MSFSTPMQHITDDELAVDKGLCDALLALRNLPEVGDAIDQPVAGIQRIIEGARAVLFERERTRSANPPLTP